ncbi:MAG: prolyl oligopeptidase family serine peptidase, partial [bacterium]|nr:prolyl oligopeptidase family serine peptidase [bacterium]
DTIEKIIFESQPRFYVTANLYVPKTGKPPYPGVLCALMHESGGKADPTTQRMLGSFATQGYVALAWDFVGEGAERSQVYDREFKRSKLIRQNTEHASVGTQCLLVGDCLARYTVWDGMRALDYLVSRPEVDKDRIGCTGNSGGGGLTAQLAVLDDRVTVAAPSCWITTWDAMFNTVGVQDGEQVVFPWISEGLDYGDYLLAFAPKPYLILAVMRDFFPISGARAVFEEAKTVYGRLGAEAKVSKSEVDGRHGYHKPNRLATYAWFARWLRGVEENAGETDVEIAAVEELACTETGQVATSLGGETVISLNRKRAE